MTSGFNRPDEELLSELKNIVGPGRWTSGSDAPRYYEDPRGRFEGKGCLIVMPETTEQVASIVRLCNSAKVGIVPFSGGTGVVAGQMSIESANAVVVSLERMNKIRDILVDDGVIVARTDSLGAGLTKQIAVSETEGDLGDLYNRNPPNN